jgi:hypothetical protein
LGHFGGFMLAQGLDRRLVRRRGVCNGCHRHCGGVRRGFVVAGDRGASAFKANLRYFSGAWIADVRSAAFVVIGVCKPAFVLAVLIIPVSQAKSCG